MSRFPLLLVVFWLVVGPTSRAADQAAEGWSADLLHRILTAESTHAPAPQPSPAGDEMVLRTYHLSHLRVGEAGKSQNVLAILSKLLPPGSSTNTDVPANSVHILTTPAAHKAIWEFLSAVDVADQPTAPAGNVVPPEVQAALKKFAETGEQSSKVLAEIGSLKANVAQEIADIDARQRQQTTRILIAAAAFALLVGTMVVWMVRRRPAKSSDAGTASSALVLAPEQLTHALTPVHEKMRTDMLGLLNEVAIKLQAQHNEQQKLVREQQQQLESARHALAEERRQFISETGTMVVQAVERVDATTAKLAKQQDKVAELVQELQDTVRELDETKDDLRTKQVELEKERAKIAALSILLEEGGVNGVPQNGGDQPHDAEAADVAAVAENPRPANGAISTSCTTRDRIIAPTVAAPSTTRFQFLPPDHPES